MVGDSTPELNWLLTSNIGICTGFKKHVDNLKISTKGCCMQCRAILATCDLQVYLAYQEIERGLTPNIRVRAAFQKQLDSRWSSLVRCGL
jgi:hypothetical protein